MKIHSVYRILNDVIAERTRQNEKWGWPRDHSHGKWLAILMEEIGEVAKALLEGLEEDIKTEAIHSIAVLFAWLESKFYDKEK